MKTCSIKECGRPHIAKGLCSMHYDQVRKYGQVRETKHYPETCKIEGCDKKHSAKGLCRTHYGRVHKTGHAGGPVPEPKACIVKACDDPAIALGLCVKHYSRFKKHGHTGDGTRRCTMRGNLVQEGKSYCPRCEEIKPLAEFNKDNATAFGVSIYCKACAKAEGKKRYRQNKERSWEDGLKHKFGISAKDYQILLRSQGGGCAICSTTKDPSGKRLAVDHDHNTLEVRGILCSKCNRGIGFFDDNTERLQSAIAYLSKMRED